MRLPSLEPEPAGGRSRARAMAWARRAGLAVAAGGGLLLTALALQRIGLDRVGESLLRSSPSWVIAALGVMCASMVLRALSWHAILRAALPDSRITRFAALQGTSIGVLMSATLPARLGEPSRAIVVARRAGRPRETLPTVIGTLVSQTLLNVLALVILGVDRVLDRPHLRRPSRRARRRGDRARRSCCCSCSRSRSCSTRPAPSASRGCTRSRGRCAARSTTCAPDCASSASRAPPRRRRCSSCRPGCCSACPASSSSPRSGLDDRVGLGAAAAVLLAVNVTAVLPATPSNLGVFQAACVAVLTGAFGVSTADALGYGIVLQAVEIATAVVMGMPALLKEGLSWRDVRLRALHSTPVRLPPLPAGRRGRERLGRRRGLATQTLAGPPGHRRSCRAMSGRRLRLRPALRRRQPLHGLDGRPGAPARGAQRRDRQPLHAQPPAGRARRELGAARPQRGAARGGADQGAAARGEAQAAGRSATANDASRVTTTSVAPFLPTFSFVACR